MYHKLFQYNSKQYNYTKAIEELFEFGELLAKSLTKIGTPKEPTQEALAEEFGDLLIRMEVLKYHIGEDLIKKRIEFKLAKFKAYLEEQKYQNI